MGPGDEECEEYAFTPDVASGFVAVPRYSVVHALLLTHCELMHSCTRDFVYMPGL